MPHLEENKKSIIQDIIKDDVGASLDQINQRLKDKGLTSLSMREKLNILN